MQDTMIDAYVYSPNEKILGDLFGSDFHSMFYTSVNNEIIDVEHFSPNDLNEPLIGDVHDVFVSDFI